MSSSGNITSASAAAAAISIYSASDLNREMEGVMKVLSPADGKDKEWGDRLGAMKRLQGVLEGGAAEYEAFTEDQGGTGKGSKAAWVKQIQEPLMKQLGDLRSAIAKEACLTVVCLSRHLDPLRFGSDADAYMPQLLKMCSVTIQIMSESANFAIVNLILNTRMTRSIPKVIISLSLPSTSNLSSVVVLSLPSHTSTPPHLHTSNLSSIAVCLQLPDLPNRLPHPPTRPAAVRGGHDGQGPGGEAKVRRVRPSHPVPPDGVWPSHAGQAR
jgi:hypothetical protein